MSAAIYGNFLSSGVFIVTYTMYCTLYTVCADRQGSDAVCLVECLWMFESP